MKGHLPKLATPPSTGNIASTLAMSADRVAFYASSFGTCAIGEAAVIPFLRIRTQNANVLSARVACGELCDLVWRYLPRRPQRHAVGQGVRPPSSAASRACPAWCDHRHFHPRRACRLQPRPGRTGSPRSAAFGARTDIPSGCRDRRRAQRSRPPREGTFARRLCPSAQQDALLDCRRRGDHRTSQPVRRATTPPRSNRSGD